MRLLARILVIVAAVFSLLSSYMHGFFARPVVLGRVPSSVDAETLQGLNAAWILGTAAMIAFGVLALLAVPGLGRRAGSRRVIAVAGTFFLGYGAWAFSYRHFHPHFIGFMAIGALFFAGAALAGAPRHGDPPGP